MRVAKPAGKTHLAITVTAHIIRAGAGGGPFFNLVDPLNRLEQVSRHGDPGALAGQFAGLNLVSLDELGRPELHIRAAGAGRGELASGWHPASGEPDLCGSRKLSPVWKRR